MGSDRGVLGVVGTLVWDTIHPPPSADGPSGSGRAGDAGAASVAGPGDDAPVEAWGGISYALSTFEALAPDGWCALPIVKVGRDLWTEAEAYLRSLGRLESLEGVRVVAEPNNRVELRYEGRGRRTEKLTGGVPGWSWDELEPLARRCRALYVNFIAGWELDLAAARRIRDEFPGPVYCDLHSLLLGQDEHGVRVPDPPAEWRQWISCFDYLQVNRDELATLASTEGREPWELAEELVGDGLRALLVTLGPAGAAWISGPTATGGEPPSDLPPTGAGEAGRSAPRRGQLPVRRPVGEGDPTGCGDVWGMACFTSLLRGDDLPAAVERANAAAAQNATCRGAEALPGVLRSRAEASAPPRPEGAPGRDARDGASDRPPDAPSGERS